MIEPIKSRIHLMFRCPLCENIGDYIDISKCISAKSKFRCMNCGEEHYIKQIKSVNISYEDKEKKVEQEKTLINAGKVVDSLVSVGYTRREVIKKVGVILSTGKAKSTEHLLRMVVNE